MTGMMMTGIRPAPCSDRLVYNLRVSSYVRFYIYGLFISHLKIGMIYYPGASRNAGTPNQDTISTKRSLSTSLKFV